MLARHHKVLISSLLLLTAAIGSAEDRTLRWKLAAGDEADYVVGRRREATIDLNGNLLEITFASTADIHWKVESVEGDKATVVVDVTRLVFEVKSPIEEFVWDSLGDEPQASSLWEDVRDRILALMDTEAKLVVNLTGKVESVELSSELTEALNTPPANPQVSRFLTGVLDQKGIESLLSQVFLAFPESKVDVGTAWEEVDEIDRPPFGKQIVTRKFTYAGRDEGSGDVDTVVLGSQLDFQKVEAEGAEDIDITMKEQEGKGTAEFDAELGRTRQMQFVQKLTIDIAMGGSDISQSITETMTLNEGKSPVESPDAAASKSKDDDGDDDDKDDDDSK